MYFPREVYDQIVGGSLCVEGISVQTQNAVTKANNLENQTVFLRRGRDPTPIECQVIRSNDLLLKDVRTGRFLRAQANELEYVNIPEEEGTEVTFALQHSGKATLSYLIHGQSPSSHSQPHSHSSLVVQGIVWSPRYNLKVNSDQHTFEAWADMTNQTKRDYKIQRTELFGGDVHLQQARPFHAPRAFGRQCCMGMAECCCCDSAPQIQAEGELAGVYWYSIDQPFVLVQQSTFSLPFVEPKIQLEKYFGLQTFFQEQTHKGKFQRKYRLESDRFLPKGNVTVREDGRVVGQAQLADLSAGEKQDLDCGNDADVSFRREVKVVTQKRDSASYQIRLTIKNGKKTSIRYEYKELISSVQFTVVAQSESEDLNEHIQSIAEGVQIHRDDLAANAEHVFQYELVLQYRNPNDQS